MKISVKPTPYATNAQNSDYADYSSVKILSLIQIPQYEHLQILICKGNGLTSLAGVENLKHLWKLDVSNNEIRILQHLSRFIALGTLILSNNQLQWIELQHIRHMSILDLRLDGNHALDSDPNYRTHVLDCLPRIWMLDAIFISTIERNQVEEFFVQSSLSNKPVRHKLSKDQFMPTNLKDRSVNGLFGTKATELFAKFPQNCFINSDLDKKRLKHLSSWFQDLCLTEMRYTDRQEELLRENRHTLYHMMDSRQTHVEEFNMLLILLITDILFQLPSDLLNHVIDITRINTIGNINVQKIFASSESFKCKIVSLLQGGAKIDRDENHSSAFYEKLFNSVSIVLSNHMRQIDLLNATASQAYPSVSAVMEAKAVLCLEVMQVLIICPLFYTLVDNPNVHAILKHALDKSPAYGSVKEVLQSFNAEQKTPEEQKELLSPILGNILKMTIRTLSTKRTKKVTDPNQVEVQLIENDATNQQSANEAKIQEQSPRLRSARIPAIGDRILTGPQSFGRIVTLPDAEIAMIQLDNILATNGAMVSNGGLPDSINYVNMNNFEWDGMRDFWRPKHAIGDKITLQLTTSRGESPRLSYSHQSQRKLKPVDSKQNGHPLTTETHERSPPVQKVFDMNLNKADEMTMERPQLPTIAPPQPPVSPPPPPTRKHSTSHLDGSETDLNSSVLPHQHDERKVTTPEPTIPEVVERPLSVRIVKQKQEIRESPVLIESMLLLYPPEQTANTLHETYEQNNIMNDYEPLQTVSVLENTHSLLNHSGSRRNSSQQRKVHVPVQNASQWFNGPDLQNERSGRLEKVVSSILKRSFRRPHTYAMPKVPTLTSPSSKDHALYKGVRPTNFQDFCLESNRIPTFNYKQPSTPMPHFSKNRFFQSRSSDFTPLTIRRTPTWI